MGGPKKIINKIQDGVSLTKRSNNTTTQGQSLSILQENIQAHN